MRTMHGPWMHRRRPWTRDEKRAAWTVAAIVVCAAIVAVLIQSGAGVVE